MDDYVESLQFGGLLDSDFRPIGELNLGFNLTPPPATENGENWVENLSSGADRALLMLTARNAHNAALPVEYELNEELKKIKNICMRWWICKTKKIS